MSLDNQIPSLVRNLGPMEKRAVLLLTRRLVADHGDAVESISLFSTGRAGPGGPGVELLLLTHEEEEDLEEEITDAVADVLVETGVLLMVRKFSLAAYGELGEMGLPIKARIEETAVELFHD